LYMRLPDSLNQQINVLHITNVGSLTLAFLETAVYQQHFENSTEFV
jgi:hypothetical protein